MTLVDLDDSLSDCVYELFHSSATIDTSDCIGMTMLSEVSAHYNVPRGSEPNLLSNSRSTTVKSSSDDCKRGGCRAYTELKRRYLFIWWGDFSMLGRADRITGVTTNPRFRVYRCFQPLYALFVSTAVHLHMLIISIPFVGMEFGKIVVRPKNRVRLGVAQNYGPRLFTITSIISIIPAAAVHFVIDPRCRGIAVLGFKLASS